MGHSVFAVLDIPCDIPVPPAAKQALAGNGAIFHFGGATDKGYDITLDPAAAFVATLDVSVDGARWEEHVSPLATGQGSIAAHFNFVRVRVTAPGDYGDTTIVRVAGKER